MSVDTGLENNSRSTDARDLQSELARLCLPREYRDACRVLAWVCSICALFVCVGIVGLNPPAIAPSKPRSFAATVPVVIEPVLQAEPQMISDNTTTLENTFSETERPVVAAVIAFNPGAAAVQVPAQSPAILSPVKISESSYSDIRVTPTTPLVVMNRDEEDWGGKSDAPEYPAMAQRRGYQGRVVLEISFDTTGGVSSARVRASSGYKLLDDAAVEKVRRDLRFAYAPDQPIIRLKEYTFQLR
jgi:TonB family protein